MFTFCKTGQNLLKTRINNGLFDALAAFLRSDIFAFIRKLSVGLALNQEILNSSGKFLQKTRCCIYLLPCKLSINNPGQFTNSYRKKNVPWGQMTYAEHQMRTVRCETHCCNKDTIYMHVRLNEILLRGLKGAIWVLLKQCV